MRYLFLSAILCVVCAFEKDITFTVPAGSQECFYQKVAVDEVIDLEYQVIGATHGVPDISFQLTDPLGLVIIAEYKKAENAHRHTAKLEGDYRFCFDNTFSTFSEKTVFFDLLVENETADEKDYDDEKEMELGGSNSVETYIMRVKDISDSVWRIQDLVHTARRQQELHAAHEARDRNLAEDMCARVLTWSLCQILLMLTVGFTQVFFLKSLFDSDSSYKKFIPSLSN